MNAPQKQAWFNLVVVLLTTVLVVSLYPWLGVRAQGGFALLALYAFGTLFHRRHRDKVATDERDVLINRRASLWAYSVLWIMFVAAALLAPRVYGDAVPVVVIQASVWIAFMLMLGVQSIAALVQYGRTSTNAT